MKRANKAGSVFKVKGKRRKKYRARVTAGYRVEDGKAKQIVKDLGYFLTRQEAEAALNNYADCPYDLDTKDITLKEVYEEWLEVYSKKLRGNSSLRSVTSAFAYMHSLHNRRIKEIKASHLRRCLDEAYVIESQGKNKGEKKMASASTKARMKSVLNLLFDLWLGCGLSFWGVHPSLLTVVKGMVLW